MVRRRIRRLAWARLQTPPTATQQDEYLTLVAHERVLLAA